MYSVDTKSLQALLSRLCVHEAPLADQPLVTDHLRADLDSPDYWRALQDGLAFGSTQQKKLCLAILRLSILDIDHDIDCQGMRFVVAHKAQLIERYAKFHTLYVTIVLNRYINQVEDCIDELQAFLDPRYGVDPHWVLSLFSASLEKTMQESVRKICGKFVLEHGFKAMYGIGDRLYEHLTERLLPWMALGNYYNSNIVRMTRTSSNGTIKTRTRCLQGDRVTNFLAEIIGHHKDASAKVGISKCVLQYLAATQGRMFSFARGYFLDGICRGLLLDERVVLDEECALLIGEVTTPQGSYHEIVSHCMLLLGKSLLERVDKAANSPAYHRISDAVQRLLTKSDEPTTSDVVHRLRGSVPDTPSGLHCNGTSSPQILSISTLNQWISESNYNCLRGDLLVDGCRYMTAALEQDRSASPCQIQRALEALWEMLEIQEFPRHPLMAFPSVVFHERVLQAAADHPDLKSVVGRLVLELQRLCLYRVYLFARFSTALRQAVVHTPAAGVLPMDQIIVRFAKNPPETRDEFRMEHVWSEKLTKDIPWRDYEYYYGYQEAHGYAAFLDMLNAMPNKASFADQCKTALDTLLEPWIEQKRPPPVFSVWKNTPQLQVILILCERCISPSLAESSPQEIDKYLETFWELLRMEPLPRFRYLLEWIIARIFVRLRRRHEVLEPLDALDLRNPKYSVSQIKLALMLACLHDTEQDFAIDLMNILMVLSANQKVAVRHEAQWSIPILWDFAMKRNWREGIFTNPAIRRMNTWIRSLDAYKEPPAGRQLESLNPVQDHTLVNLVSGEYLLMEPSEGARCQREDFLDVYRDDDLATDYVKHGGQSGNLPLGPEKEARRRPMATTNGGGQVVVSDAAAGASVPLQVKAAGWEDEVKQLLGQQDTLRQARPLVVIASLIDNELNVGGLSRVSEIFGCEAMHVRSLNVVKSKNFESVAVSSGMHLPLVETEAGDDKNHEPLVALVRAKKAEGYTVVGLEQTDGSRVLGAATTALPARLVLLVGSEREGIPARLLGEVDWCVEVRQVGLTRSMNVQTATAVVLYEYGRQHP